MALLNDIYIFIEKETVKRTVQTSSHPVEEGLDLTDFVRRSPLVLSLSGEIVGAGYEDDILELERLQKNGEVVEYTGSNTLSDAVITSFHTDFEKRIRGGCSFSMELQEIRIAKSPFAAGGGTGGTQQVEAASGSREESPRTHTVKNGDTLWKIAKSYYGNGAEYPKIFDANREILSDPDELRIGQVLAIP